MGDLLLLCRPGRLAQMTLVAFLITGVSMGSKTRAIPHSANARLHWAKRSRWNKAWKEQSGLCALAARGQNRYTRPAGPEKTSVVITLHTLQLLDQDNAHAAIKPILDGLKGILIEDDSPEHIVLTVNQVKVSKRVEEHVGVQVQCR